jgi:hypothetical protein
MLSVSLNQRPSLRTSADVKTRFHRDRPNNVAVGFTDRGKAAFSDKHTFMSLRLEKPQVDPLFTM